MLRESIQNLNFTNVKPSGIGHDVSANGDNSILLYYSLNGNKVKNSSNIEMDAYDLIIYSKDIILAPADCRLFFSNLRNVIRLDFNNRFDTRNATNMSQMFNRIGYNYMEELILEDRFNTSKVTNMWYMFSETGYNNMKKIDLGKNFDTKNVTDMFGLFHNMGYNSMTSLDLGDKFDTSKAIEMGQMFWNTGYKSMTLLDLGPSFKKISAKHDYFFIDIGKSGACTIKAHEDIYNGENQFKLNKDSTSTINYTRGKLEKAYFNTTTE